MIIQVSKEEIQNFLKNCDGQKYAGTFYSKINARPPDEFFVYKDGDILGFYAKKATKDKKQTTLDLLFVDERYRGKHIGEKLVKHFLQNVDTPYIRISSEKTARKFYEKLGIKFRCQQKSGTYLAIFKKDGDKDEIDDFIKKKMQAKRGGCYKEI